jgi:hypothetical protein
MKHRTRNVNYRLIPDENPRQHLNTAFERECDRLGLDEGDYPALEGSNELRKFCQGIKNSHYIPERLLAFWKMEVVVHL